MNSLVDSFDSSSDATAGDNSSFNQSDLSFEMQRMKEKTNKPLIKYASALNRAVRRQILINAHKKAQLRNFKINNAMIMTTE